MSVIQLQDAIGEIQDCYILGAHSEQSKSHTYRIRSKKWIAVFLAAVTMALAFVACAPILFNSLSGDDLSFHATYQGNGIVEIAVENKSDKTLHFQKSVKVKRWSIDQEIQAHGEVIVSGPKIPAHGSGVMTIDLSKAYDLVELETPLKDDSYYLILTNNNFLFGQDWICSVDFSENQQEELGYPNPISPAEAAPDLVQKVEPDLQHFFDDTFLDPYQRRELHSEYYEACAELIQSSGKTVIHPVSPAPYFVLDDPPVGTVFDSNLPEDAQYQLIGIRESSMDDFFFPVGASWKDTAKVFSVVVPQSQSDCYRVQGAAIQVGYVMIYDAQQCQTPDAYTLIHGQLIPVEELSSRIVYEDSHYIAYNVTDYFFTEIDSHISAFQSWRTDLFYNEDVLSRIQSVYAYIQNGGIKMRLFHTIPQ